MRRAIRSSSRSSTAPRPPPRISASRWSSRSSRAAHPKGQLKLVQNFVNSGAQGVATSVPGESMARALNEIIASGVPIVQYNLLARR